MEIEEFLETDILIYLDEALDKERAAPAKRPVPTPSVFLTRDYEKELFAALDKHEIGAAKEVLHALKQQFDDCPSGTPDKEQLKTLLVQLYEKFKEHIDALNTFNRMDAEIDGDGILPPGSQPRPQPAAPSNAADIPTPLPPPELTSGRTAAAGASPAAKDAAQAAAQATPAAAGATPADAQAAPAGASPAAKAEPREQAQSPPQRPELPPVEGVLEQGVALLDRAEAHLIKGEVHLAVQDYKLAKQLAVKAEEIPAEVVFRYRAVFANVKAALVSSRSAKTAEHDIATEQGEAKGPAKQAEQPLPQLPTPDLDRSALDRHLLLQIEQEKHQLDALLRSNDIQRSLQQYRKMRMLCQEISDPALAESAARKLHRIHRILERMRQHAVYDEQKLMAVP